MPLNGLWQQMQRSGYAGVRDATPTHALDNIYLALVAFAEDDLPRALHFARAAAQRDPDSRVYRHAVTYLERVQDEGKANVYVEGAAFAAFIRGGGNVGLYAAVSRALQAVYESYSTLDLLDIGVGDGLALLPALVPQVASLTLVEPSEAMLARTLSTLEARGIACRTANMPLQRFMAGDEGTWDIIQATWSLQSIPPDERTAVCRWLRAHGRRVLVAEFDVPHFEAALSPDRVQYVVAHYERGLAEYDGDGGVVAQGFLMPVMFGYFDRTAARTNWEGPIHDWIDLLRAAGFASIAAGKLYRYFWADAFLIDAR